MKVRFIATVLVALAACGPAAASAGAVRPDPVRAALAAAQAAGTIDPARAQAYGATYGSALGALPALRGVRRRELRGAVHIVRDIARRGALTAERMPLAFLTLSATSSGGLPTARRRPDRRGKGCAGPALQAASPAPRARRA